MTQQLFRSPTLHKTTGATKDTINPNSHIFPNHAPPTIHAVRIYFSQKGVPQPEADAFFLTYKNRGWTGLKGNPIRNWKPAARRWIAAVIHNQPWLFDRTVH